MLFSLSKEQCESRGYVVVVSEPLTFVMYMNGCVGTHLESTSAMTFGSHSNNDTAGVLGAMVSLTTSLFGILNTGKAASCSVSSGTFSSSGSSFTCSLTRLLLHRQSL